MKKIIRIFLSLTMLLSMTVCTRASLNEPVYYVALGDSISAGYGIEGDNYNVDDPKGNYKNDLPDCYSHIVAQTIQDIEGYDGDMFDYYSNISVVGLRVKDMAGIINDPDYVIEYSREWMNYDEEKLKDHQYHDLYIQELTKADLISLQFGNSDLFVECLDLMEKNETIQNNLILKEVADMVQTAIFSPNKDMQELFSQTINAIQEGIDTGEVNMLTVTQAIRFLSNGNLSELAIQSARNIADCLPEAIGAIQSVNDHASIVLIGLYNGFKDESGIEMESDSPLMTMLYPVLEKTVGEMVDESVVELNTLFEEYCKENGIEYVDIKSMPLNPELNLHPNTVGHQYIASQVVEAIVKDISITVNPSVAKCQGSRQGILGQVLTYTIEPEEYMGVESVLVNDEKIFVQDLTFVLPVKQDTSIVIHMQDTFPFQDVSRSKWYFNYIKEVYEAGLMTGTTATTFNPGGDITRGQLVTILWRNAGSPASGEDSFLDIQEGKFYTTAVAWAKEKGIVKGYNDGTFKPSASITRQELAIILHNYVVYCNGDSKSDLAVLDSYPDAQSVSGYAKESMAWAVSHHLISGDQGYLKPKDHASRAQCAKMVLAALELIQ